MRNIRADLGFLAAAFAVAAICGAVVSKSHAAMRAPDPHLAHAIAEQGNAAVASIRDDAREAVRRQDRLRFPATIRDEVALAR